MDQEIEQMARDAVAHREAGSSLIDSVRLLVDQHPGLKEAPLQLTFVLRKAFDLSISHVQYIIAWVEGRISQEKLEKWLQELQ